MPGPDARMSAKQLVVVNPSGKASTRCLQLANVNNNKMRLRVIDVDELSPIPMAPDPTVGPRNSDTVLTGNTLLDT